MEGMQTQSQQAVTEEYLGEHRLWMAVIVRAVEDWRSGTLRVRRDAQNFLFEDDKDFNRVCDGAGLEPSSLRARLLKIGRRIAMKGSWANPIAAYVGSVRQQTGRLLRSIKRTKVLCRPPVGPQERKPFPNEFTPASSTLKFSCACPMLRRLLWPSTAPPFRGGSVTHVSGTMCHLRLRPLKWLAGFAFFSPTRDSTRVRFRLSSPSVGLWAWA
jgi:hypothetical protein